MKINYVGHSRKKLFSSIDYGEIFRYENCLCLKIDPIYVSADDPFYKIYNCDKVNAIILDTGKPIFFEINIFVEPVEGELTAYTERVN